MSSSIRKAYDEIIAKVNTGESNYPSATIDMMEAVLDYSGISVPVIVIGFAPPYYPPTHSDQVKGKEGFGTKAFEKVRELSEKEYGQKVDFENFFTGISDLSYGCITSPFDYVKYSANTPLWGRRLQYGLCSHRRRSYPGSDIRTYRKKLSSVHRESQQGKPPQSSSRRDQGSYRIYVDAVTN